MTIKNSRKLLLFTLLLWFLYTFLYVFLKEKLQSNTASGYLIFLGEVGFDLILAFLTFNLYKKTATIEKQESKKYYLFYISFFFALIADSIYNLILNIEYINNYSSLSDSLFDIPFIIFLLFQLFAWFSILINKTKKIPLKFYVLSLSLSSIIFSVFIFFIHWKISYISLVGIYNIIDTVLEFIGFSISFVLLLKSEMKYISYLASGYMTVVISDLIIRSDVVQSNVQLLSPLESTWVLGLMLMSIGFYSIQSNYEKLIP